VKKNPGHSWGFGGNGVASLGSKTNILGGGDDLCSTKFQLLSQIKGNTVIILTF
jgi:hypothetical protein